jgi:Cu2+-exporting ATPase
MQLSPAILAPRTADTPSANCTCAHCGEIVRRDAALFTGERAFCCNGCLTIAALVAEHGWDEFYATRDGFSPRPEDTTNAGKAAAEALQSDVKTDSDGACELAFRVDGTKCASCVWLVEKALSSQPGVQSAQVSYGNSVARLKWSPGTDSLATILGVVERLGYRPVPLTAEKVADRSLLTRLGIAAFCAGNVMTLSIAIYAGWLDGMDDRYMRLFEWLSLALTTPAVFYSAQPFFQRAFQGVRYGVLGMDVPIALAIAIMFGHGVISIFTGGHAYMDSLTMLIALLLGGRWVEETGRVRAEQAADAVSARMPSTARKVTPEGTVDVPASSLVAGDCIVIGLGGIVAADGVVISGRALADTSALTGEAEPVDMVAGTHVSAGSVIVDGEVDVRVDNAGEDTLLATMARRIAEGASGNRTVQRLNDRVAPAFTAITLLVAGATAVGWALYGGIGAALSPTVAVLVTACPCALALATPAALAVAMGAAGRRGAWVRDADAVLRLADIERVLLDKTGTLTEGERRVTGAPDLALQYAASLERGSSHPVAKAIRRANRERALPLLPASDVREVAGKGISGIIDGQSIAVVGDSTGVTVTRDGVSLGHITLHDVMRAGVAVDTQLPVPIEVVSGDRSDAVRIAAATVGAAAWHAAMNPDQKLQLVIDKERASSGVMFIGDGVNDAAAIAEASVGIAMSSGTPAALLAADVVIFSESLRPIEALLRLGRITRSALAINAGISITYNVVAVSAAAAGLVNPLVAAILMPLSSAVVIVGALSIEWRMRHGDHRPADPLLTLRRSDFRRPLYRGRAQWPI